MSRRVVFPLLLITLLVVLTGGCTRDDRKTGADEAVGEGDQTATPGDAASDDATLPAVPMRLTDEGQARSTAPEPAKPVSLPRSRPADPRDTAFAEVRFHFTPAYPYDIVLGRMQHAYVGTIADRSAYDAARVFLGALVAGELPEDVLHEGIGRGARAILEELLWEASDLADVRVGEVYQLSETDVSFRFRLVGETQEAVGELVLTNKDGRWYTADIQVDYLDRPTGRRFDPVVTPHRTLQ